MTAVSDQGDLMVFADPCRDGVTVADLPIQAGVGLPDYCRNSRITIFNELTNGIHIAWLEPRLLDVLGVLVGDDPVKLLAVPQGILNQVLILADPDVDTFLFDELGS